MKSIERPTRKTPISGILLDHGSAHVCGVVSITNVCVHRRLRRKPIAFRRAYAVSEALKES